MSTARIPLGRGWAAVQALREAVRHSAADLIPVGSLRRFDATVGDISLLAVTTSPPRLFSEIAGVPGVKVLNRKSSTTIVEFDRYRFTVYSATPETLGAALVWHTGARAHTAALAQRAKSRALEITAAGLRSLKSDQFLETATEEQVYQLLDLPFIAPEMREGQGEIDAAEAGRLPTLVQRGDIRGDLHMHSTWSDGHDTIEAMVIESIALGYQYIAITDHSQSSGSAYGLTIDRLERQRQEIRQVRERFPAITILHGCEVDILPDGQLDYPDDVLADLDLVLASLHDDAGQDGTQLTERYLRAIHHPLVNIITHPTNRLVGYRPGYRLDFPRLFEAAVQTGTVLEIDGAPAHLDMDGSLTRRAIQADAIVSIDSDCHRAEWLDRQMLFGVATARRGWAEPRHVLNTESILGVREIFARKRRRSER